MCRTISASTRPCRARLSYSSVNHRGGTMPAPDTVVDSARLCSVSRVAASSSPSRARTRSVKNECSPPSTALR